LTTKRHVLLQMERSLKKSSNKEIKEESDSAFTTKPR